MLTEQLTVTVLCLVHSMLVMLPILLQIYIVLVMLSVEINVL